MNGCVFVSYDGGFRYDCGEIQTCDFKSKNKSNCSHIGKNGACTCSKAINDSLLKAQKVVNSLISVVS